MHAVLGADSSIHRKFQGYGGKSSPRSLDWVDSRWGSVPRMMMNLSGKWPCLSGYHPSFIGGSPCLPHPSALEGIRDGLQSLSERSGAADYQENDTDRRAVCELAEDLRDAVIEYQVGRDLPIVRKCIVEAVCSSLNRGRYTTRTVD